jgi:type IV fimbrial biogenesis protein FimT
MQNSRQAAAANELLSSMHFAREMAIARNARVTMCPSTGGVSCEAVDWNQGWLIFRDMDDDQQVDADEPVELIVDDPGVLSIATAEFANALTYRPNGRAMGGNVAVNTGELTLCDHRGADYARVAIIEMSGRPRIARERMDGSAPTCPTT